MRRFLRWRRRRVLMGAAAVLLAVGVVVVADGVIRMREMQHEVGVLERDVARLRAETVQLTETVERLRKDPQTIERLAREELGWVRKGEAVLKFPATRK